MTINFQTLITLSAAVGAIGVFVKLYNRCYDLVKHQREQDKQIDSVRDDNKAVMAALLGVLDGLIEQGCNGTVHGARDALQKHIIERGNKKE